MKKLAEKNSRIDAVADTAEQIIRLKSGNELRLVADSRSKKGQINLYRLTNLDSHFNETSGEEFYIAVPAGRRIAVRDIPAGQYILKKIN